MALALAMAGNGAGGQTLREMAGTLQLPGAAPAEWNAGNKLLLDHLLALDPKIKLEIANSLLDAGGCQDQAGFYLQLPDLVPRGSGCRGF